MDFVWEAALPKSGLTATQYKMETLLIPLESVPKAEHS